MKQFTEITEDKQKKQRKFLLVLPAIVLPFLTFFLWSLGLVGGNEVKASPTTEGLNMQLPDARLKENKSWNKLSFYEQADKDSAKYRESIKNDPFLHTEKDSLPGLQNNSYNSSLGYNPLPPHYEDANEYKVNQELAELNTVLNKPAVDEKPVLNQSVTERSSSFQPNEVDRLEHLLQSINQPDSSTDSETAGLNAMMDKILDIQHPERVGERLQQKSEKNKKIVYPVVPNQSNGVASLLQNKQATKLNTKKTIQPLKQNAFYSLDSDTITEKEQNIIEAEIQQTQTLVSGSTIKLSSATNFFVNGILVPKGTLLYGIASLNGERLTIAISSIHYQNNLLPVSLSVYDLDGLQGLYIPGSISRDAAKQSGSEAVNNIGITTLDPSIAVQAAGAGIQAAKSLINKKVKQIKITVKAGYQVLLKDDNHK